MTSLWYSIRRGAMLLGLVAVVGAGLLAGTNLFTAARIAENERQFLLQKLNQLLPASHYDNQLTEDTLTVPADPLLGTDTSHTAYVARKNNQVVAVFLNPVANDGYNGDIHLLVAIRRDLSVAGVRVVKHLETVGLGDKIEEAKSDWILRFAGTSLHSPPSSQWKVKKDGGHFDQFTGATITPRAVVKAVKHAVQYATQHQHTLFPNHEQ